MTEPAPNPKRWLILAVVSAAQFMTAIDGTVVNVMAPQLRDTVGLSTTSLQWVVNSYVLLFGGLLLLGGRLNDVLGRRQVFLFGVALFTVGSILAGTAGGSTQLLIARAIQGIAAALLAPASLSIMVTTFTDAGERAKAFGVWGTVIGVGASVGTLLGGAVVDIGWRWAFYINIPVGIALGAAALTLVAPTVVRGPRPPSDVLGAVVGTAGLFSLVFGIVETTSRGWSDPVTLGAFVLAAVLLPLFVRIERTAPAPLLPLGLFANRGLVAGSLGEFTTAGLMMPCFFLLPLYMQEVLGYSPLQTGLAYIPTSIASILVAPVVSALLPRIGPRLPYLLGAVMLGGTLLVLGNASPHSSYWAVLLPVTALLGLGLVLCLMTTPVVGTSGASEQDAGSTSAVLNVSTQIGGALGLAVAATVVQSSAGDLRSGAALTHGIHAGLWTMAGWLVLSLGVGVIGFRGLRPAKAAPVTAGADVDSALADAGRAAPTDVPDERVPESAAS